MDRLDTAETRFREGRYAESLALFSSIAESEPSNPGASSGVARSLYNLGRYDEAYVACEEAMRLDDGLPAPHLIKAYILSRKGLPLESESEARRAIELDPTLAAAFAHLGVMLESQGKTTDSEATLRKSLELDAGDWYAHYGLARSLAGQGRHTEAMAECLRAARLRPSSKVVSLLTVELVVGYRLVFMTAFAILFLVAGALRLDWIAAALVALPMLMAAVALVNRKFLTAVTLVGASAILVLVYLISRP